METYCASCKNENSSVKKAKQNSLMLLSICVIYGKKKSIFIKNKEIHNCNDYFKINKIINKFLLKSDSRLPKKFIFISFN